MPSVDVVGTITNGQVQAALSQVPVRGGALQENMCFYTWCSCKMHPAQTNPLTERGTEKAP